MVALARKYESNLNHLRLGFSQLKTMKKLVILVLIYSIVGHWKGTESFYANVVKLLSYSINVCLDEKKN
jgi:hypothetical protein